MAASDACAVVIVVVGVGVTVMVTGGGAANVVDGAGAGGVVMAGPVNCGAFGLSGVVAAQNDTPIAKAKTALHAAMIPTWPHVTGHE